AGGHVARRVGGDLRPAVVAVAPAASARGVGPAALLRSTTGGQQTQHGSDDRDVTHGPSTVSASLGARKTGVGAPPALPKSLATVARARSGHRATWSETRRLTCERARRWFFRC